MPATFRIYVTGFGPFPDGNGGHFDRNASHLLTNLLPASLQARSAQNPSPVDIQIINPTSKAGAHVKTEYAYIRQFCADLHGDREDKSIDLYVHIGMASGWQHVAVERRAFRQDMTCSWAAGPGNPQGEHYMILDDAGKTVKDAGPNPWATSRPTGLNPHINIDAVVSGARQALACHAEFDSSDPRRSGGDQGCQPIDIVAHEDPGTYCCGFIFYESLANRFHKPRSGNVLFCHIPSETDDASLRRARDGIIAVMVSVANQLAS